jgi:hypothetical protein
MNKKALATPDLQFTEFIRHGMFRFCLVKLFLSVVVL